MTNLTLKITENWLQKLVFLLQNKLVIEDLLHGIKVANLSEHSQSLELVRVLRVVQDCLRDDDICFNFGGQVRHIRPALRRFHLEAVKHQFVADVFPHVADVSHAHGFKAFLFALFKPSDTILRVLADSADSCTPFVHLTTLSCFRVRTHVLDVLILDKCLHAPIVLPMYLTLLGHIDF